MAPPVEKVLDTLNRVFNGGILNAEIKTIEGGVKNRVSGSILCLEIEREILLPLVSHLNELYPLHVSCPMPSRMRDDHIELIYALTLFGGRGGFSELPLILKLKVPLDDPSLPTLTHIVPGIAMMERETLEMLGIDFIGLKDKRRLFTPEDIDKDMKPMRNDLGYGPENILKPGETS